MISLRTILLIILAVTVGLAQSSEKLRPCSVESGDAGKPQYPASMRGSGIQGTVVLEAIVNEKGCVETVTVVQKLDPTLDKIAKQTVKSWKFKPAQKGGKPVIVKVAIPVEFKDPGR